MYVLLIKNREPEYFSEEDIKREGGNDFICCPYHEDSKPSLSVDIENKRFHCFGCNQSGAVLSSDEYECHKLQRQSGSSNNSDILDWGDDGLFDELIVTSAEEPEAVKSAKSVIGQREHIYQDENGSPLKKKLIIKYSDGSKDVRQQFYDAINKKWLSFNPKDDKGNSLISDVPYKLPNLIASDKGVFFVEGEKDVETLEKLNLKPATTLGSTSNKLKPEHFKYFKDRAVMIFPDEDEVGYKYAREIAKTLYLNKVTENIMFCFLPHKKDGEGLDVSDYVEANTLNGKQFSKVMTANVVKFEDAQDKLAKYDGEIALGFEETMSQYKDFPTEDMPKVVRDYAKIKSAMDNTNIEYHALGILVGFGSLAASKYELQTFMKWKSNTTVNFALVGTSGQSKSHPLRESIHRIVEYNREQDSIYNKQQKEYERWFNKRRKDKGSLFEETVEEEKEKPQFQPYMLNKFTMEGLRDSLSGNPRGVLLYVDELRGLFNSFNQYKGKGDDVETIVLLIDGQDVNIKLASDNYYIKKPRVSIIGTIQPNILKKCFDEETKDNGVAFRFLFCCPRKKPFRLTRQSQRTKETVNRVTENLIKLYDAVNSTPLTLADDGSAESYKIYFDTESEEMFLNFINNYCSDIEKHYGDDTNLVEGIVAKIKTYYPKLTLLIHLIRYYSNEVEQLNIDKTSMLIAERLCKYFIYQNYLALNTTGDELVDNCFETLKNYAVEKSKTTFKLREIVRSKLFGKRTKTDKVKKILAELSDDRKISIKKEGTTVWITLC